MILLYIDPGTGSMLFSVLLGIFTASLFASQKLWIKIKNAVLGGRLEKMNQNKIPLVIFAESKRYWSTFEQICDELERRGIRTEYWTGSDDDPAFNKDYSNIVVRNVGSINKAVTKLNIVNAGICLSTTPGLNIYQWKKSDNTQLYVHIFHSVSSGMNYRMFGLDHYDAVMLPGDSVEDNTRRLEKLRHLPAKEMVPVGIPYLDRLSNRLASAGFEKNAKTTVLLAPTWGINSLFNQLGDELIDGLVATGYNIVIRPHPQSYTAEAELMDRLKNKYPETELLHWNSDNDNLKVLAEADIMISDYSGVIYDFAFVFDKPVIYSLTHFNKDPYDAWFMEEEQKTMAILPEMAYKITKDDIGNIREVIDNALTDEKKASVRAFAREHFWYNHGQSAVKCVDYIEEKLEELKIG